MCVILACEDIKPTKAILEKCEADNSDGGGIAWIEKGKIQYKKGITSSETYKISQSKPLPQVIHFRFATIGKTKWLCHPIPLTRNVELKMRGEADAVLFHNGHYSDWKKLALNYALNHNLKIPGGVWNDTRVIAWLIANTQYELAHFLDEKLCIFEKNGIIRIYGDGWTLKDGITYSNLMWTYQRTASVLDYNTIGEY